MKVSSFALAACVAVSFTAHAQEREDRTLLTQTQMTSIINEVSGDRALNSLLEMVPYHRIRPPSEYDGHFRESQVVARMAREAGFANVTIEEFGPGGTAWQPTKGELWMTSPKSVKLFDIHDIALALGSLNVAGDLSGELVDVAHGRAQDFEGKDVRGKFVLTSGSTNAVYPLAVERGDCGCAGYQRHRSPACYRLSERDRVAGRHRATEHGGLARDTRGAQSPGCAPAAW